jgi:hypothetical protein
MEKPLTGYDHTQKIGKPLTGYVHTQKIGKPNNLSV